MHAGLRRDNALGRVTLGRQQSRTCIRGGMLSPNPYVYARMSRCVKGGDDYILIYLNNLVRTLHFLRPNAVEGTIANRDAAIRTDDLIALEPGPNLVLSSASRAGYAGE